MSISLRIDYHRVPDLPKLAWVASLNLKTYTELSVFHGTSVECSDTWMVEGVWDGDFPSGGFHTAENFFGSGIRIDGECIYFIPSSTMKSHLVYCLNNETLMVSNSLVLLLAYTGATLDDTQNYYRESMSILRGIKEYEKEFTIIHPKIERFYQVFYENIVVTKDEISFEFKDGLHEITSYEHYYGLLWGALSRIGDNFKDPNRKIPISAFSTLSSGYDSTAVACLVKKLGVETCFTVKSSASWMRWSSKYATDEGTLAAQALNLNVIYEDMSHSSITEDELYFLSTNYGKSENNTVLNEIGHSSMTAYIEQHCSAAILFTGYEGDKVWDINISEQFLNDELKLEDVNLGFEEIRLKSGFIHIPVPYILARNIRSIVSISRSEEMKPWSLNNDYDRPIARRIAESSGVPREAFGMYKRGVARHFYRLPLSLSLRAHFLQYLKEHYDLNPWFVYTNHVINQIAFLAQKVVLRSFFPKVKRRRSTVFWPKLDISFLMWIWATHLLRDRFRRIFLDE